MDGLKLKFSVGLIVLGCGYPYTVIVFWLENFDYGFYQNNFTLFTFTEIMPREWKVYLLAENPASPKAPESEDSRGESWPMTHGSF